jgi:undecaprenyl-diphosphatase
MTPFDAFLIAVVQGITELFPVSSLGHAILVPRLAGITVDLRSPQFLPFLVILHLGTAAALFFYFWREWWDLLLAGVNRGDPAKRAEYRKLLVLLIVGTVPAVVVGYGLNHVLRDLFASPRAVAVFLLLNGVVLFAGEFLRRRAGSESLDRMGGRSALFIGTAQALALLPGISRSGVTIAGGLVAGLSHAAAARFSFLLATPIIVGAGVLEVPKLLVHTEASASADIGLFVAAGAASGAIAYASVALLMYWFRRQEVNAMRPFAYYCWALGLLVLFMGA